ncbi:hypothetical protein ABMA09_12405 [Erwinia rhapontici]|uniref:Uncharacterized protein n=1 Tax=Erwinia rhapontici TaxID=55212 RepID=A0ABM7N0T0_ERWRD|nr:hypothetical protein [Erwinia rhapontici]BCQ35058.1 hypothetical protein ERHA53_24010 [Erwinia rhapontici]BCQ45159.1 hypothetical protein ERHA55_26860 [Erwinia rhapontici]
MMTALAGQLTKAEDQPEVIILPTGIAISKW